MFKKKSTILIMIIVVLILIILIINIILNETVKNNTMNIIDSDGNFNESNIPIIYNIEKVRDKTKFFTVSECVKKYKNAIKNNNPKEIYSLLDKEYVKNNNITEENLIRNNVIKETEKDLYIEKMNYIDGESTQKYSVLLLSNNIKEFFIVNLDLLNFTFSIKPIDNSLYKDLDEIELTNEEKNIILNDFNRFEYIRYTEEDIVYEYFEYYNNLLENDYKKAYDLLDLEYKDKRFINIENFKEYIEKTENRRNNAFVSKYTIEQNEKYNKYVIVDNFNNYYIIKENSPMDLSIQLDNYTIKPENYSEEYMNLTQNKKISTNINLFITMINNKDYNSLYMLLDEKFKKNNFIDLEEFKRYIDREFFDYNTLEIINAKNEGEIFIYNLKIKSGENNNALERNLTIIMKLEENTEFVMSFSFDK